MQLLVKRAMRSICVKFAIVLPLFYPPFLHITANLLARQVFFCALFTSYRSLIP